MEKYAEVIISISNANIDKIYNYIIPDEINVLKGVRVIVPFGKGNTKVCGFVIGVVDTVDIEKDKLKKILSIIDGTPMLSDEMIELVRWMREKYYTTYASCIKAVLPVGIKTKKSLSKKVRIAYLNPQYKNVEDLIETYINSQTTYSQGLILEILYNTDFLEINEIKSMLLISDSPFKTLQKKGIIIINTIESPYKNDNSLEDNNNTPYKPHILNDEQNFVVKSILELMHNDSDKNYILLHGVTGSGKTEVYLRVIEEAVNNGKQAIVLVPEISLTPQTVRRFTEKFGNAVSVTHSRMSLRERFEQWKKAINGNINIMIGPRSAVFTPFKNLGVIIIDEEHENTYKSETTPKYDAREVAYKRIQLSNGMLLLGSATPSIETYFKAKSGIIKLLNLKERVNKNALPSITIVDMRKELIAGNLSVFSKLLREEIQKNLDNKEQTILFLNRRGHSTFVSCRKCGHVMKCQKCYVSYTYHLKGNKLICHYCGETVENPTNCPECNSTYIKQFGAGTEKIEEEVRKEFPEAITLRMDLDTTKGKNSHEKILKQFTERRADILIGTQMIAKGHDFDNVTFVGIIAADTALNAGDFRSAETTYQLITQVAGRAGRAQLPGRVVVQTYNCEHYSIVLCKDQNYERFYKEEITVRREMQYPPFTSIFQVLFTGASEKEIIALSFKLLQIMKHYNKKQLFEVLGPSPAYISKINNLYRWKIIVKSVDEEKLKNYTIYCIKKLSALKFKDININITLNPVRIM